MTVRRTPQAEAILELRLALAEAANAGATDGAGSRLPHGEGPHDAYVAAPGPTAEGTLPAPKDDHRCGPHCWGRCTHNPGAAL